jgi:hypothetical protein
MEAIGGVLVHTGHTGNHHGVRVCVAAVVLFALSRRRLQGAPSFRYKKGNTGTTWVHVSSDAATKRMNYESNEIGTGSRWELDRRGKGRGCVASGCMRT